MIFRLRAGRIRKGTRMEIEHLEGAVEALLFAVGESVEVSAIAKAIGHDTETTRKIIRNMMLKYNAKDRGIKDRKSVV